MSTQYTVIGLLCDVSRELLVAAVVPGTVDYAELSTSEDEFTRWGQTFLADSPDHAARLACEYVAADHCDECEAVIDGDGYDGLCGNCTDRAELAGRWC